MRKLIQTHIPMVMIGLLALGLAGFIGQTTTNGTMPDNLVLADHCGAGEEVDVSVPVEDNKDHVCSGDDLENNVIVNYLRYFIQFLTAGVGLVITIMIAIGGVQYITAKEDPQAVQAAKQKILNAIIALILFILMYAILSYLVPIEIF